MPSTTTTPVDSCAPDPQLVAEEHDQRGHDDVGQERHDEDLVVEDPVEHGAQAAEDGVERGHDGDRQVGLDHRRHLGPDQQSDHDSDDEAQYGDHDACPSVCSGAGCRCTYGSDSARPAAAARPPRRCWSGCRSSPAGRAGTGRPALSWNVVLAAARPPPPAPCTAAPAACCRPVSRHPRPGSPTGPSAAAR